VEPALPGPAFGAQMALVFPSSSDLRITAGSPSVALGLHGTWSATASQSLRPRVDYTVFAGRGQNATLGSYSQSIDTRVSSLALGVDWLWQVRPRLGLGLGVSAIRWSVDATNGFTSSFGHAVAAGTSRVWQPSVGPVLTYRLSPTLEVEGRWIRSHYGMENAPANAGSLGLVWRFGGGK
jgi:hypothetical protein